MNKNFFTWIAAICCFVLFQSATISTKTEEGKPQEKILLERAIKTRSATITQVNAYTDGNTITVDVANYTGDVYVQVYGAKGAAQTVFSCYNNGTVVLDILSLPAGTYTVSITLNNTTYTGTFMK